MKEINDLSQEEGIVTLFNEKGEEISFLEIAGIAYKGGYYAILQPIELLGNMDDDEALVFRVFNRPDGADIFELELDKRVIDAVFREYDRMYVEMRDDEE